MAELLELIDCQNDKKWQRWAERLGYKAESEREGNELVKAANMIKAFCANHSCVICPLWGEDEKFCKLGAAPSDWGNIEDEE